MVWLYHAVGRHGHGARLRKDDSQQVGFGLLVRMEATLGPLAPVVAAVDGLIVAVLLHVDPDQLARGDAPLGAAGKRAACRQEARHLRR